MSTAAAPKTAIPAAIDPRIVSRILEEGYGPGAWHGADLKAALSDVSPALAFWRPSPERHSIAEIALHHAYTAHGVRSRLPGITPEPFPVEGDDWFALPGTAGLNWPQILELVDTEQRRLNEAVSASDSQTMTSEPFELLLGITCHAVYHAGQVQLLKRLAEDEAGAPR